MITTIIVPIGALIYIKLNRFYQFLVLSLSALLPLSFGDFRSIPSFQFIEWLPFVTLLILMNDLISVKGNNIRNGQINFRGLEIFIFAIIILIVWTSVSFIENEIFNKTSNIINNFGTTRVYFSIFNNILLFFVTITYVATYFDEINFEKYFKILIFISIFLGFLRIATYFFEITIPFLSGAFEYGGEYGKYAKMKYGGTAFRLGGLNELTTIGIPALFSYYVYNSKFKFISFGLLIILLFYSGGRTVLAGTFISIFIFSFIFFPRSIIYLFAGGSLLVILAVLFLPDSFWIGQWGRITTFSESNALGVDIGRAMGWKLQLETFIENPIWGKGLTQYSGFIYSSFSKYENFARNIASLGGHGSYISLLSIFGIGGITYFLLMLLGGIILALRNINRYINQNSDKTAIAVFAFLVLIIKAFDYFTAKNGLDVPILFFIVGFIASLTVLQKRET